MKTSPASRYVWRHVCISKEAVMAHLDRKSVRHVAEILAAKQHPYPVTELTETARSAADAARALSVEVGAIVNTLLFVIEAQAQDSPRPVIVLIAGDRQCRTDVLPSVIGCEGRVRRPDAAQVKSLTGYSIGGVSPVGLPASVPVLMDSSLGRFPRLWSAAGHPYCVFASDFTMLATLSDAMISDDISAMNQ